MPNAKIIERRGIKINKWDTPTPALAECACGRRLTLCGNDNECGCGRCYNLFGNEIKSRQQREEERYEGACDD